MSTMETEYPKIGRVSPQEVDVCSLHFAAAGPQAHIKSFFYFFFKMNSSISTIYNIIPLCDSHYPMHIYIECMREDMTGTHNYPNLVPLFSF